MVQIHFIYGGGLCRVVRKKTIQHPRPLKPIVATTETKSVFNALFNSKGSALAFNETLRTETVLMRDGLELIR
ncbi:hypothetical protein X801_10391, partial [Opisthorchis viverrini]